MAVSDEKAKETLIALRAHMLRHERYLNALGKDRYGWEDDLNFINGLLNQPDIKSGQVQKRIVPSRQVWERIKMLWNLYSRPERFVPE